MDNLRFYSFVAGLYLSPLQHGLQTGHAISEMSVNVDAFHKVKYREWALHNKTIIILNALNSGGVLRAYARLQEFAQQFELPTSLFHEDVDSLGGAATACGIIVPSKFYAVTYDEEDRSYCYTETLESGIMTYDFYMSGSDEHQFIQFLKGFRLV